MAKIFISYSSDSRDIVEELVQDFIDDGHDTWFDQRLTGAGGQKWWDKILSEIRTCDIFVAALTPDSLESQACQRELKYADRLQKTLLPVRLSDKVQPDALPHRLAELQWVDYCRGDKLAFKNLRRTIRGLPGAPPLPAPSPPKPRVPNSLSKLKERIGSTSSPVVLSAIGNNKIEVIKGVRAVTGLGLKEAKDLVEAAPKPIKEGATKEEAEKIKAALEKAGAKVELKSNGTPEEDHKDQVREAGPGNNGATASRMVNRELVRAVAAELGRMDDTWCTPEIPVDKATNARNSMKMPADESMLVLFDDTIFVSGKHGLLIGVTGLYYKQLGASPEYVSWEEFLANPVKGEKSVWGNIVLKVAGRSWNFRVAGRSASIFLTKLRARALDGL